MRRKKHGYFTVVKGAPDALLISTKRRVSFDEVDLLGIAWYGRYAEYFQEGSSALGRECGLSFQDFQAANLMAPIVQFHVDYHLPLILSEEFTITTSLIWNEGSRLNCEYMLIKENGSIAVTGYTVQMFIDAVSKNICISPPELLQRLWRRWKTGELLNLV